MMQQPASPPNSCGTCGGKHWTPREVLACETFGPAAAWKPTELATERQIWYIKDLLKRSPEEVAYAKGLDKKKCSGYIDDLKAGRGHLHPPGQVMAASAAQAPPVKSGNDWTLSTPRPMVESAHVGRYAVRPDENEGYKFVRISRPKNGNKAGCIVIQTQHSEAYKDCVIIWPSGRVSVYDKRVDPYLLLVVVDPVTASRKYGQELGRCCSCGRELTDPRSIHYGIGPECEKGWPEIINQVDQEHDDRSYEDLH